VPASRDHLAGAAGAASAPAALATLLLVDGDAARRRAVGDRLRAAGLAVHTAADGAAALDAARRRPPDLLLVDAQLPEAAGVRLCRAVRGAAERRLRTVPILLLAAGATEEERVAGLEAGADACVAGPATPRELLARVRALLRRAPRSSAATGPAARPAGGGDLVLDPLRRRVRCRGRTVALRPKEFALLAFLLDHAGGVFTRPQLLTRIWGPGSAAGERTVDVHMRRLREKLERHPSRPALLETVRGVGYRLRSAPPRRESATPAGATAAVGPARPYPPPLDRPRRARAAGSPARSTVSDWH
jgi:DNA-binding response OmpR family regulator